MKAIKKNSGFSMVELIIVIAIMAILAAALVPQLIKYVRKSRRVTDIQTADEIQASYVRGFITMSGQDVVSPASETGDIYIRNDSTISNPPQTLTDFAFLELGEIPLSSTSKDYYWHIEYTPATGKVNKISLSNGPNDSDPHEVYPDSEDFEEGR